MTPPASTPSSPSTARPTSSAASEDEATGTVLAVLPVDGTDEVSIVLDRTPFYAESGGQVGDTGTIETDTGRAEVLDTDLRPCPELTRHRARLVEGEIAEGQVARAAIDADRRDAIRRNHTGTHILHWALREVLGEHVKQQGSLVAPDRLRFDFSHFEPVTAEQIARIEDLANREILANAAGPPLRDHQGRRRGAGGHRLLRRQVRRHRPGPRGRPPLHRAVRRHPRAAPWATSGR